MRALLAIAALCLSCSGPSALSPTRYHNPLADSNWQPLSPRLGSAPLAASRSSSVASAPRSLRKKAVEAALVRLNDRQEAEDFGERDVQFAVEQAGIALDWRAHDGIAALVDRAWAAGAYSPEDSPGLGDIVLFHNQRDSNQNRQNDDWWTGCGIVVSRHGSTFEVVTRTGHGPRTVVTRPVGPATRELSGRTVNSFARIPQRDDPPDTRYLAGQLYAGFIDVERLDARTTGPAHRE